MGKTKTKRVMLNIPEATFQSLSNFKNDYFDKYSMSQYLIYLAVYGCMEIVKEIHKDMTEIEKGGTEDENN